jgi:transposase
MAKPVFKKYEQDQNFLLPPSLEELIDANHPVRVVNKVINSIDLRLLGAQYKGGGASSYHPAMLLKVIVYSYLTNIYSSRKMESAIRENIHLMWLSGMQRPDHHTLNRFRSERLRYTLKTIFVQVVNLLADQGLVSLREVYVDGTKLEANANKYTFVWGNAIQTNKIKMKQQLDELWRYAKRVAAEEKELPEPPPFETIDADKVKQTIEQIQQAIEEDESEDGRQVKQKLRYATKNWPVALDKYKSQEQVLDGRNSYSKTDTDATFMRMKEDHMKNGQLKPGYNLQISTNDQYIVDYTIHQSSTDTATLAPHLESHKQQYGSYPDVVVADAGYGSEQNYTYLENNNVEGYVKYNYFDKDQQEAYSKKHPFIANRLYYNAGLDVYYCPMGQQMQNIGTATQTTASGFKQTVTRYQAANCEGCPLRVACHKSKNNRIIEVNHTLNEHKRKATERLTSEKGIYYRKRRSVDVEPVFGNIKSNHGFRRFMLRGKEKVLIEAGLLALAHNLRKKVA